MPVDGVRMLTTIVQVSVPIGKAPLVRVITVPPAGTFNVPPQVFVASGGLEIVRPSGSGSTRPRPVNPMPMPIFSIVNVNWDVLPGVTGLGENLFDIPTLERFVSVALVGSEFVAPWVVVAAY